MGYKSVFERLSEVNVNDKTEKKGRLTYLSWAWAWAKAKKLCPDLTRTVYEADNGRIYHTDGRTAWVKVGITINGLEHIDYLPVMDNRNKSIKVEDITSFDVNKSIQRSTAKALALHGLGLYIYAGEDLPEPPGPPSWTDIVAEMSGTYSLDREAVELAIRRAIKGRDPAKLPEARIRKGIVDIAEGVEGELFSQYQAVLAKDEQAGGSND